MEDGWYIALHCTALHCTALHCTALHCTALHCNNVHQLHESNIFQCCPRGKVPRTTLPSAIHS
jgi:hypothetical protein